MVSDTGREVIQIRRLNRFPFCQFTDIDEQEREAKSASWPISSSMAKAFEVKIVKKKHRFSWELLSSTKGIQALRKSLPSMKFNRNKSKTSETPNFKTSTPVKGDSTMNHTTIDSFGNSTLIPSIHASTNKSNETTRSTTCSDRLGVPKTSLNDFKRLLLTTAGKKAAPKPSAVEQLKLKRDLAAAAAAAAAAAQEAQPMRILDLTSSPKSFTNRRMLQSSNASPFKKSNLASPRSRWKYSTFNKMPIAPIPEANAEDECGSGAVVIDIHMPVTPPKITASKETSEIIRTKPVIVDPAPRVEPMVIETNLSMEENIFLQTEENNFMKGEVRPAIFTTKISQKPTVARKPIGLSKATTAIASDECSTKSQKTLETSF